MAQTFPASLPDRLARDGWWLTAAMAAPHSSTTRPAPPVALWPVLALIVVMDWLSYGARPGLGMVLAAACLVGAVAARTRPALHTGARAGAIFTLAALPMAEAAGPVPLLFLILGTGMAVIAMSGALWPGLTRNLIRLLLVAPFGFLGTAAASLGGHVGRIAFGPILRGWLVAALLGPVFLWLFALANPIIQSAATDLLTGDWTNALSAPRLLVWILLGLLAGACLTFRPRPAGSWLPSAPRPAPPWLGAGPVTNALVVFNLLFAAQTVLDMTYLWAGAALPEGMTYAQYAHRGSYPLLATSLLAGAFMLVATAFGPPTALNRKLLLLWVIQTMALLGSAALRLDLYVSAYTLTYLRLSAFIWMGLVAAGLALMAWRIGRGHANRWLITRLVLTTLATLYTCSFINFADVIASYNVARAQEVTGTGQPLDRRYFRSLGPQAQYAADRFAAQTGGDIIAGFATTVDPGWRYRNTALVRNWRAWGYRDHRLSRYLSATQTPEATSAQDPHRR